MALQNQLDSQLLVLSSTQRDKTDTRQNNGDFTLHAGNNDQLSSLVSAYVISAQIPNIWGNVLDGRNVIRLSIDMPPNNTPFAVITVPPGNYTQTEFEAVFLQLVDDAFVGAPNNIAVTALFSSDGRFSVTTTEDVYWESPTYDYAGDVWGEVLGYAKRFAVSRKSVLTTAEHLPNYTGIKGVFIECKEVGEGRSALIPKSPAPLVDGCGGTHPTKNFTQRQGGQSLYESVCAYVPITGVPIGSYALYTSQDPNDTLMRFENSSNKQIFHVRILDMTLKTLKIPDNYDVTIVLRITFAYK
jgi:hypothetical protein